MTERTFDLTDPAIYRFWITDRVRFSDQDGSGHINNVAYAAYVETGRVAFMQEVALADHQGEEMLIIVRLAIDYLRESHWPGEVRVGTRLIRLGGRSCVVGGGVFKDDVCIATAECVMALTQDGRASALTGPLRRHFEKLLAE